MNDVKKKMRHIPKIPGRVLKSVHEYLEENTYIRKMIIKEFHRIYYNSDIWKNTFWFGVPCWKCPLDLWIYQEILYEIKPDVIIECGTAHGGSALFLASICDLIGNGRIVTIDIKEYPNRPEHERITYILGSSTSTKTVEKIRKLIDRNDKVMVILDSDHHKEHVLKELRSYSNFVTKNSYLIVEDTNINGHPVLPEYGPGPMEAVEEFLKENKNFVIDRSKEKFLLTFNPKGFLKRVR